MLLRSSKSRPAAPAKTGPEPAPTLAQEKADFTAEGSPPPGQVGAGTAPSLPEEGGGVALPPKKPSKGSATGRRQPPPPAGPVRRASKRNPGAWRGNG